MKIHVVASTEDSLGEGVIWNLREGCLYWVDTYGPRLHRYAPRTGAVTSWPIPEVIGSLVFDQRGGIVAGVQSGFCQLELDPVRLNIINSPQPGPDIIFNDGKCDRRGRYFVGTMDRNFTPDVGVLWRLDPDLSCHEMERGITVPNGLAWSPDNKTMYFADTRNEIVYSYDYDIETGGLDHRRVFLRTNDMRGRVDGATVDAEGYYWAAMIHDGSVCRFAPSGELDRRIELPVMHPTMCTFGGDRLDTLYVVSSRRFLDAEGLRQQPLAGSLFAVEGLDVQGLPEPYFAG